MKTYFKILSVASLALLLTACVQDLNTKPIDKNSTTSFNQDAVFSKCYATLALSGQKGPAGDCDIDDLDEGTSAFYRMNWELNEFGTDEGWWIWNDVGLSDIRIMNWNGDNALVKGLYFRLNIDIKLCNHFLSMADDELEKTAAQKAEVRFIRALNAWCLLDMYKVAPFTTTDMAPYFVQYPLSKDRKIEGTNTNYPPFLTRTELYEWLEEEIQDLIATLPENRLSLYRVDKYAAYQLLSRLYINAEIYTGTPQWAKAQAAAEEALKGPYTLYTTPTIQMSESDTVTYTAYQKIFMGDNCTNGSACEVPLFIYQDGKNARSWGTGCFIISMFRDKGMVPCGSSDTWQCFRTSPEFVYKFVSKERAADLKADEYEMPALLKDDRAIMCSHTDTTADKVWGLDGSKKADFYACWSVLKFTNVMSTAVHPSKSVGSDPVWPDIKIPLFRIAEAYMIKAEALFRQGQTADALAIINNIIRKRANAAELESLDEATLCDEWSREFYCEGHRRTTLIRFNRFAGPKSDVNKYNWEGRADQTSAAGFKADVPEKWNWYPVPNDDKGTNPNYKALKEGDGYDN